MTKTLVLKFGGASLKDVSDFESVAQIIIRQKKEYDRICVVVSAMEGVTDYLLELAGLVGEKPPEREKDMLLTAGERISMALLAMTLQKHGVKAVSLTGSQAGIITTAEHSNAKIIDVKPVRLKKLLESGVVAVIAGFQGVSTLKEVTTLGRGGSDTTAVALAVALDAEKALFYKDVDGVYSKDPKKHKDAAIKEVLTYQEALDVVGTGKNAVLHPRCVELAKKNSKILHVRSFKEGWEGRLGSYVKDLSANGFLTGKCYECVN